MHHLGDIDKSRLGLCFFYGKTYIFERSYYGNTDPTPRPTIYNPTHWPKVFIDKPFFKACLNSFHYSRGLGILNKKKYTLAIGNYIRPKEGEKKKIPTDKNSWNASDEKAKKTCLEKHLKFGKLKKM